ncbi:LutC/YkgG family protein [Actinokineospora sp. HUAS TT18]|uniref:LutC/YkgG family protein n=1 Tax=Actinokineospora sp. HUAS TT18 TaxID=3447451 RepID=UPI003F5253D3
MSAREEILGRVRKALSDLPAGTVEVSREYETSLPGVDLVELFAERVDDYRAKVVRIPADTLPAAIAAELAAAGVRRVVAPLDLPAGWVPGAIVDSPLSVSELDTMDGVVTGCAVGIAETGTIVLDAGIHQGRRAITLVPDYHLCVVRVGQIVGTVPEAIARLDQNRPLTWISGPSATSDIELNRVEGVHGPRTLVVLIAE